jgi:hypothetical protein
MGDNKSTLYHRDSQRLAQELARVWHVHVVPHIELERQFTFNGQRFGYLSHSSHKTWLTERAVELPLAEAAICGASASSRVLEVGNVLTQYFGDICPPIYRVADKYEVAPGVEDIDVLDLTGQFDLIISISTLEHVGLDELPRDWTKARHAVDHLRTLMAPNGRMLMTWALSYSRDLDDALRDGSLEPTSVAYHKRRRIAYHKRRRTKNKWFQTSADDAFNVMYGCPNVYGNAIAVVEW